ncbi:putative damage-inducible protein DinB [Pullulanibacillus pueri]|uniref:Protein DinB n=1 Tax=Pullulanibacillus pueri TaxID=1437324 RepID=A0A8J2ZTG7_9BACL|nr:DinB family protein [Pullulanibacillus pueri]MBM7681307.1 putative damage-inducible protein DinB [Pullulanibacillus pueri]GGH77655.1 protein DinB [Pullulanibacillus pueri]
MSRQTQDLYGYHKWANQRIFKHLKSLPEGIDEKEVQSVFPSIAEVLSHIYRVDQIWFSVMKGEAFDETMEVVARVQKEIKGKNLIQIEEMYQNVSEAFQAFLEDQDNLDKIIECAHPEFGRLETPLSQLVQHVVNHGTYHRGNITAMLRQMGYAGVPTDYIFYLYELAQVN